MRVVPTLACGGGLKLLLKDVTHLVGGSSTAYFLAGRSGPGASAAPTWMEAKMRLPLLSLFLLFAAFSAARADDLPCISTTFNLLSPNDKVCVSEFDDPAVPGAACFISQARKGGGLN